MINLMNGSGKGKYTFDKVVLLGILALGLVIAQLFILSRSRLALSGTIELPYTGVTARIPQGNGWQSETAWQFVANTFTISSVFGPAAGRITALVEIKYLLAPSEIQTNLQIKRYSRELAGTVIGTGKIQNSTVLIDWTHIRITDKLLDVFLGIVQLPNGRRLSIKAKAPSSDAGWIEQIFTSTAKTVSFENDSLLESGGRIIEQLKTNGLSQLMPNHQQQYFLIKNARNQISGFLTSSITVSSGEQGPNNVRLTELYHIRTREGLLGGQSLFQGYQKLQQFLWMSKTDGPGTVSGKTVRIELAEDGRMMVESYIPLISRSYIIGPAALPEIFIEPLIKLFIESRMTEALVDLIFSDGRIVPTRLSLINSGQNDSDPPAAYIIRLDFLDQQDYYGKIYLDDNKQTFKTMHHRDNIYIYQRSSKDEVLKYFPVWRDYFLRM